MVKSELSYSSESMKLSVVGSGVGNNGMMEISISNL
jgi:hypothetical protein